MKQIEVKKGDGWIRWKQDSPVPPGLYYQLNIRKPDLRTKKSLSLIAACSPTVRFAWLAPAERWVQQLMAGGRVLFDVNAVKPIEPDWDVIGIDPSILRPWQRQAVTECWTTLAHGREYRQGWIASLGAGKTLAGLCISQMFNKPAVLADRYLHPTWVAEAEKWGMEKPLISTYESCHNCLLYTSPSPRDS